MKYLKYTHVDAVTGIPVTQAPARNGPAAPAVVGLQFVWARESRYPTEQPELFGTCPDESDTDVPGVLGVFVQHDFEVMQADEMAARAALVPRRWVAKLAFRSRFTAAERAAIEFAALDDPSAAIEVRQQSAMLRALLADVSVAEFIDLDDADTRAGVQMLESVGLLTEGRAAEILDAPVADHERPHDRAAL